jgi:SAM-dependent methyltransferase
VLVPPPVWGYRNCVTLRGIFDEAPELYDRVRPGYPPAMFDDLAALTAVGPGARVLELGCGTGQATLPLARRGCAITAVELGPGLAAVARRNLAAFPAVEVVTAAFESWPLPREPFDVVLAATSFHWIDPAVRLVKSAAALRPGGALAVVSTHHVAGGDERFFELVQACYERWMAGTPPGLRLADAADVRDDADELMRSGAFARAVARRYERELTYTTQEYLDLLRSYSGHRALAPEARDALFTCIATLIDDDFGGRIAKRYMTGLAVAYTPTRHLP